MEPFVLATPLLLYVRLKGLFKLARFFGAAHSAVRAERQGLSACIPVALCTIPGLPSLTPYVLLPYPLVPTDIVNAMLSAAQAVGRKEILFYLSFTQGKECGLNKSQNHGTCGLAV